MTFQLKQVQSTNLPTWALVNIIIYKPVMPFFGRWWQWKLDPGIGQYDLTQRSCNFPAISWKMDLFSSTMSRGKEGKQVVLLLEYGLNDVPSFICLVIGHIFPLSPFLHAVGDVPSRLRLAKRGERWNLLLFFSLYIFFGHWIFRLLQP